jgi:anti-anti-sigma regulatory factor
MAEEFVVFLDEAEPTKKASVPKAKKEKQNEEFVVFLDDASADHEAKESAKKGEFVVMLDEPASSKNEEFVVLLDQDQGAVGGQKNIWKYALQSQANIENVASIWSDLKDTLSDSSITHIEIDASEVQVIDTAVLQMLAYFGEHFTQRGIPISYKKESVDFSANCKRLGFERYMDVAV